MKQLEDRIKERLEGYESNLPEGDLAEFKALLDKAGAKKGRKLASLAWLAPTAIAACVALWLTLGHKTETEMLPETENEPLVAEAIEPTIPNNDVASITADIKITEIPHAHAHTPKTKDENDNTVPLKDETEEKQEESIHQEAEHLTELAETETSMNEAETPLHVSTDLTDAKNPKGKKVGKVLGGVLGGTGTVLLASALPSLAEDGDGDYIMSGPYDGWQGPSEDKKTGNDTHYFPLRTGLSFRVPIKERWSFTTGLEYSLYTSKIGYSVSDSKQQKAHYLGIPIRADYSLVRNKWMDVYVGAGLSTDFCVNATEDGCRITKDKIGFSLIATGGFQFNMTKQLGLFIDPTFSWNLSPENLRLDTYKSEHRFMFSISTGLRFTLGGKR